MKRRSEVHRETSPTQSVLRCHSSRVTDNDGWREDGEEIILILHTSETRATSDLVVMESDLEVRELTEPTGSVNIKLIMMM